MSDPDHEKSVRRVVTLLPPSLYRRVAAEATTRLISVSATVRQILADHYRAKEQEETS